MRWFMLRNISIVALALAPLSAARGGDIYVANSGIGTIGEYTTSGAVENASLISGLSNPVGIAVTQAVPEPSSLSLLFAFLAVGSVGLRGCVWRRKKNETARSCLSSRMHG